MGLASLIVAGGASSAWAGARYEPSEPVSSAIDQYVEMLPTGDGAVAAGGPPPPPVHLRRLREGPFVPWAGGPRRSSRRSRHLLRTGHPRRWPPPSRNRRPHVYGHRRRLLSWVPCRGTSGTAATTDGRRVVFLIVLVILTTAAMLSTPFVRRWAPSGGHHPSSSDLGP